jgi:hypothetical protein
MDFENLSPEQKKELWEMFLKQQKPEPKQEEPKEIKKPVSTDWISLGQSYGVSIAVWQNGITLTKKKKEGNDWKDTEKFNLSKKVMTELFVRIPGWFASISKEEE